MKDGGSDFKARARAVREIVDLAALIGGRMGRRPKRLYTPPETSEPPSFPTHPATTGGTMSTKPHRNIRSPDRQGDPIAAIGAALLEIRHAIERVYYRSGTEIPHWSEQLPKKRNTTGRSDQLQPRVAAEVPADRQPCVAAEDPADSSLKHLADFMRDHTRIADPTLPAMERYATWCTTDSMHHEFNSWCDTNKIRHRDRLSRSAICERLEDFGVRYKRVQRDGANTQHYLGITLAMCDSKASGQGIKTNYNKTKARIPGVNEHLKSFENMFHVSVFHSGLVNPSCAHIQVPVGPNP